jgi:hypothetical protein
MSTKNSDKNQIKWGKTALVEYYEWLRANHRKLFYNHFQMIDIIANLSIKYLKKYTLIKRDLFFECINERTYYKHRNILVENKLLEIKQTYLDGKKALIKYRLILPEELENRIEWKNSKYIKGEEPYIDEEIDIDDW